MVDEQVNASARSMKPKSARAALGRERRGDADAGVPRLPRTLQSTISERGTTLPGMIFRPNASGRRLK